MEKNREYVGDVLSLGSEGEGIIKCGDCTAFVPFCLEGERVSFSVLKTGGGVAYGKLTEVHTLSPDRVLPACPVFEKCGGCQLQHMSYPAQLAFKKSLVENNLKKIGALQAEAENTVCGREEYAYRNKLVLPVGAAEDGHTVVGFYAPRSHRIVPADGCPLQRDFTRALISAFLSFMRASGLKGYDERLRRGDVRHLVAREVDGKYIITVVATSRIKLGEFEKILQKSFKKFTLWLNINRGTGNAVFGKEWHICCGEGYFFGEEEGIKFKAGPNTFIQVNDGVRKLLYSRVVREAGDSDAVVLDLYSGGGLLTAMLAKRCAAAYGIEIVPEAVDCAEELKKLNGLENKMFNLCGTVEEKLGGVLKETEGKRRVIVCDPPRKGMERSVVREILKSGADRVVLVSCNPATLARDLGLLCGSLTERDGQIIKNPDYTPAGLSAYYTLISVTPFDMFPQTKHVETLVVLTKKVD